MSFRLVFDWRKRRADVAHILHLPFIERLFHPSSRRPLRAMALSLVICLCASFVASSAEWISHESFIPHFVVDGFAYLIHGLGAVPFVKYAEPLWAIFMEDIVA